MPDVQPFRAIRYAASAGEDLSSRIAPPYDVLSEADKQALLARDERNVVAIDLPHTPPKSAGPAEAYRKAADLLACWLADGVLVRDDKPAVYAYQQSCELNGRRLDRRGFLARVRLESFAARPAGIFPHEQTFGGPKADRLALTRAARCQLSPIFGLFPDESNAITDSLYASRAGAGDLVGRLGPVEHRAWRVTDPTAIAALTAAMADRAIFIADGHHRCTTAMNYLAELEAAGPVPDDHPARFCMFACVSMHDAGLAIWPTHRVLTIRSAGENPLAGAKLAEHFEVALTAASAEQLEKDVADRGPGWFAVKTSGGDGLMLHLKDPDLLKRYEPDRNAAYRGLDVAILHRVLIDEVLKPSAGEPLAIEYPHTGADVSAALASGGLSGSASFADASADAGGATMKVAFILAPTPLAAVREVCLAGELMPQKSTYFYPKLATGLTLYPLDC